MRKFRTYGEIDHETGSELLEQVLDQRARLADRLSRVGSIVAIASGKGGVGKSAITANLAAALSQNGHRVGVVDADLNGPSLARMLGAVGRSLEDREDGVVPAEGVAGIRVISMELLQEDADAPLRWKDPATDTFLWQSSIESTALREFLGDMAWGELDFLLVDVPPGTDRILRLLEILPEPPIVLMVTTPSEMARSVVSRSIRLVREARVPEVALVANMTAFICPDCGSAHDLFPGDGVRRLSERTGLEVWGRVPFDPGLGRSTDLGRPRTLEDRDGPVATAFAELAGRLETAATRRTAGARTDEAPPRPGEGG